MRLVFFALLGVLGFAFYANAEPEPWQPKSMADYEKYFQVDLDAPLPDYDTLFYEFKHEDSDYDPRYSSVWDFIGAVFDRGFHDMISSYGGSEKRAKPVEEDALLEMIEAMPKSMYEYIGPMLHETPGISEKILNYPGIKETKHKFPTRIAPQLQHIEGLEFLSPYLYYVLMPEMWPQLDKPVELPPMQSTFPKVSYDAKFYDALKVLVPPEPYQQDYKPDNKLSRSDLRTVDITPNSLLTAADVKAFVNTMDKVNEFGKRHTKQLVHAGAMFDFYERKHDGGLPVNGLKDLVNPCQRLAQRVKIIGKEGEFLHEVVGEGFTLKDWAYTCDKVVKAYRVSYMSTMMLQAIRSYQRGFYDADISLLSPSRQAVQYSTMQSILEMYYAPLNDVVEVRKHRQEIRDKLNAFDYRLAHMPIGYID